MVENKKLSDMQIIFAMEDTRKDKEMKKKTKLRKVHDLSFDVCSISLLFISSYQFASWGNIYFTGDELS